MECNSLLRTYGSTRVTGEELKAAITQVPSVIRPAILHVRLLLDISFSLFYPKSDFAGFTKHAIELSDAFEQIDCGPPKACKAEKGTEKGKA